MILSYRKIIVIFLLLWSIQTLDAGRNPTRGKQGMVVSADKYATEVGVQVLEKGGNAIDAAVAVGLALAVTYPQAGNLGGGGFMLIRTNEGEFNALDYREKAPLAAGKEMYLDDNKEVIPNLSTSGYLASGVPGTVTGLYQAHEQFGSLNWTEVVQPAIDLAIEGFVVDRFLEISLKENLDDFEPFPPTMKIFTKEGKVIGEGETLFRKRSCSHTTIDPKIRTFRIL